MNTARLKWFALMLAMCAVSYSAARYRARSVREYVTSAQVYWRANAPAAGSAALPQAPAAGSAALPVAQPDPAPAAVITLTTAAEVRSEGLIAHALRLAAGLAKLTPTTPDLRVGAAHVFTLRNGVWQEQKLNPSASPLTFSLWPYNGHFYSWDKRQAVREWSGKVSLPVPPSRAAELHSAFPLDPNNFVAAGTGASPHPYDVLQDVITRDEWHAYQNIASLPAGKHLPFPVGDKMFEILTQRTAGQLSLTVVEGGKSLPLWQAQPAPRSVTASEITAYRFAPPLFPGSVARPGQRLWLEFGGTLLSILLVYLVFLKPMLLNNTKMVVAYEDADIYEFPQLDRPRWDDYSARLEALGFVHLRDYKMSNVLTGGISRMFLHPTSDCYASVFQTFSPKAPGLLIGFISYIGEDWTVGHGIHKPTPGTALTRNGHRLSFSRPGTPPERLYPEHLAMRDKIAHDLGLPVVAPHGFETYQERSTQATQNSRDSIRKSSPLLILLKYYAAKFKPLSNDWWGDYPKEMEARTGQKFVPGEM